MAQFIDTAQIRLDIQHPKFVDTVILDRIVAAADSRGEGARAVWRSSTESVTATCSTRSPRYAPSSYFGVKVHKQKNLRAHAKLVIVDRRRALLGSMNIDRSAFDLRRELGIMTDDASVVERLLTVFDADWTSSHQYHAPDPLRPDQHGEDDFPHDPELDP